MIFSENKSFYPTPESLISKMASKIKGSPVKILEPNAGKGDIVEYLSKNVYEFKFDKTKLCVIEKDENLAHILRGKGYPVIDDDFLSFSGPDKFDLIIANPPFEDGDKHLLKAFDIMYSGQIIFLLNAETIRNPCSNIRKDLVRKLNEHNAEVEFLANAFVDAERKTKVEVALVNVIIKRNVEEDLFKDATDQTVDHIIDTTEKHEVSTGKTIYELVSEYNELVRIATETITGYYRNHKKVSPYLVLVNANKSDISGFKHHDMTKEMQNLLNETLVNIRTSFWRKTINIKEVDSRMTEKKRSEFEHALNARSYMDFTERNIRSFIISIINSYDETLMDAVLDLFDTITIESSYTGKLYEKNIHYYNGWKTNKAYKVGKKFIIPIFVRYSSAFYSYGKYTLAFEAARILNDIDKVMNYFDGRKEYLSISSALEAAFKHNISSGIVSTYFTATVHKKGTIHLTFNDENILRRFNVAACRGKKWLPDNYGTKEYNNLTEEEKTVVNGFEGRKVYDQNLNAKIFQSKEAVLMLS